MKKVFAIVAVAGLFAATSCKGDYNCDCTYGGFTQTYAQYTAVKKADAETSCNSAQSTLQLADPSATCTLNKR